VTKHRPNTARTVAGGCLGGLFGAIIGFAVGLVGMIVWKPQDGTGGVFTGIVAMIATYGGAGLGAIVGSVLGAMIARKQR
jgi:hypothetical protein